MNHRFNQAAAGWDEDPKRIRMAEGISSAMARHLRLNTQQVMLDFGTGTGLIALRLYPYVSRIIAADTSEGMLAVLRKKIKQWNVKTIEPIAWSIDARPHTLPKFDVIVSSMTLHHIRDTHAAAKKFRDILAPGGQIAIVDLDEDHGEFHGDPALAEHQGFNRGELKMLFTDAGFAEVQFHEACTVVKPLPDGREKPFTLFLMTAVKA